MAAPNWKRIFRRLPRAYRDLWNYGLNTHVAKVRSVPQKYEAFVQGYIRTLERIHLNLSLLPETAETKELRDRYHILAAPFYAHTRKFAAGTNPPSTISGDEEFGFDPLTISVVIVLGVLAISVAAVCWAVVSWEYVQNLKAQTELAKNELQERADASREGRALQPTTLPPGQTGEGPDIKKIIGWSAAGLLVVATIGFGISMTRRR